MKYRLSKNKEGRYFKNILITEINSRLSLYKIKMRWVGFCPT